MTALAPIRSAWERGRDDAAKELTTMTGDGCKKPAPGHCARGWRITAGECPKCGATDNQNCPGDIFDDVTIAAKLRSLTITDEELLRIAGEAQ